VSAPAEATLQRWLADWAVAAQECFPGFVPDRWQARTLRLIGKNVPLSRVALKACAGPGKSAVMAIGAMLSMLLMTRRDAFHVAYVLSITKDNLMANLWREITIWYGRSPVMQAVFELTASELRSWERPGEWWLRTRSFAKDAIPEAQGEALSGLHGPYVTVWLDETGSMHPVMLQRAEQAMVGVRWGRVVQAGNPTDMTGALYRGAVEQAGEWEVVEITGDPDDPEAWVHGARAQAKHTGTETCGCPACWARKEIAKYGRDNPWVQSYILGKFPPGGLNTLIGPDEVRRAMALALPEHAYSWSQKRLGVDVARFGNDRSVIFPRQGQAAFQPVVMRHAQGSPASVILGNRVLDIKRTWGCEVELFDDTVGWAHGAVDYCRVNGGTPIPVDFGSKQTNDPRYANRRSEMWMGMVDWIRKGGALPNIPELVTELCAPTYGFVNGKWALEPKDQIKDRLGFSPDLADALALTFAIPDQPATILPDGVRLPSHGRQSFADATYDPHARLSRK
jgi:phage terminase large subunit